MSARRHSTGAEPWNNAYARAKASIRPAGSIYDYPDHPGSREKGGASEAAARSMVQSAATLSTRVLSYLNANGPATTDECAAALEVSILAVRPRFSELLLRGSIEKTAERRRNASGLTATVWRAVRREITP
jgi:FaeA-like protein